VGRWAIHLLDMLAGRRDASAEAPDMGGLAADVRIPRKFLSRVLAVTSGLNSFEKGPPARIVLHRKLLRAAKHSAEATRGAISQSLRARLYERDGHRCGHCGNTFPAGELRIDHLIPLALRGADEPGNWVALCAPHNREKWQRYGPGFIRHYRGEPVDGSIGIRFRDGFFWSSRQRPHPPRPPHRLDGQLTQEEGRAVTPQPARYQVASRAARARDGGGIWPIHGLGSRTGRDRRIRRIPAMPQSIQRSRVSLGKTPRM
jgi:hypothetical protein